MSARSFPQTQAAATLGTIQACAASAVSTAPQARLCVEGGAAGVTPLTVSVRNQRSCVMFEGAPGQVGWSAGPWSIPLNITTANANVTLKACYVCRRTSGGSAVGTVGSDTGLSTVISSTGVVTIPITGALSTGSASDVFYIVIEATTPGTNQSFAFLPNQTILTPILTAATSAAAGTLDGVTGAAAGGAVFRCIGSGALAGVTGEAMGTVSAATRGSVLHPNNGRVFILI